MRSVEMKKTEVGYALANTNHELNAYFFSSWFGFLRFALQY